MKKTIELPEKVISVMCYGRGGSGLWSSLLDSHPRILSIPDACIMNFFDFWEEHGHKKAGEIVEEFVSLYSVIFDSQKNNDALIARLHLGKYLGLCNLGENKDEFIYVDVNLFKNYLQEIIDFSSEVTRKRFFQAIHVAYAKALGREIPKDPIISFGLHVVREVNMQRLVDDFPKTVFLQTVRQPAKGIASWFRHIHLSNALSDKQLLDALSMAFDTGYIGTPYYSRRWVGIRLEDTHQDPEKTVKKVFCDWLGLDWDPVLLQSTFNGKKWWNEKNTLPTQGFDKKIIQQSFREYISPFDEKRLTKALSHRCKAWGYAYPEIKKGKWQKFLFTMSLIPPFKMEGYCYRSKKRYNTLEDVEKSLWERIKTAKDLYIKVRKRLIQEYFNPPLKQEAPVISAPSSDLDTVLSGRVLLNVSGPDRTLSLDRVQIDTPL